MERISIWLKILGIIVTGTAVAATIWIGCISISPDFIISVDPVEGSCPAGGVIQTNVALENTHSIINRYGYPVRLRATVQSSNQPITVNLTPTESTPEYDSTVNITVDQNVSAGDYTIIIKGTGGDGKEHSCSYGLTVKPPVTPTPNKVYLVPQHSNAPFCNTVEVQIWANTTDPFGIGQINLTYSHCCANVTNLEYDSMWQGTWDSSIDGREWLVFRRPLGQPMVNGTVLIGNLTIHCCNESKCATSLTFSLPSKLSDPMKGDLTVTLINGTFECTVCGDVNCNGEVDVSDIAHLSGYLSHPNHSICSKWAADVNCDHLINESDLNELGYFVGLPGYELNCCD